ncbi:MAG: hypothetical protein ACPGVU_06260 [Limisphaerales bacterium]
MFEDEIDRRLNEISTILMSCCTSLEPGEGLSHEEVLASGWLADEDVEYLLTSGVTVEVARRVEGEPWVHFDRPDGSCSFQVRSDDGLQTDTATLARKEFAAFVHRIILEGRNPTITVELTNGFTLLFGSFDEESNGVVIITGEKELSFTLRQDLLATMEGSSVDEVFDGVEDGVGHWNYSHRVPNRRQALCAEAIVFELFEMEEPVEINWSENFFAR